MSKICAKKKIVRKFEERLLTSGQTQVKTTFEISPNVHVVGSLTPCNPILPQVRDALSGDFDIQNGRCQFFQKLKKKTVYVAASYQRDLQKVSSYAVVCDANRTPNLCKIEYFVKWTPCNQECHPQCQLCPARFFAIVKLYERVAWEVYDVSDIRMRYLDRVRQIDVPRAFSVDSLSTLCFYITAQEQEYIASPINDLETE